MTNKEAKEQIFKLCNTLQILPNTLLGKAMIRALDSLDTWEKALADIKETMLHYHDWGSIELKAQYKEEAYKEIFEYLERKLLEVTDDDSK